MNNSLPPQLQPREKTKIPFPSGETVMLPLCRPNFPLWKGNSPAFRYGSKPVLEHRGEPCFAELAILNLLIDAGWEGVWVATYGGTHYVRTMPEQWNLNSQNISITEEKEQILRRIWKTGKTRACFDVFAWRGDQILFCEAKHSGKDKLTKGQYKFIHAALSCGVSPDQMLIVEWTISR
jgi:hypothetical protein